jgi:hypothetical protein
MTKLHSSARNHPFFVFFKKKSKKLRKQFAWSSSPMFRCNVLNHVRGFNPRTSPAGAMSLTTGKPSSIGKKELTL